ncbi:class I SAM-dependent methyltransferase [Actinomadura barringtoniae]|uniref:Class I SAM-dependent methyltransferase n=1 Tax=Actinomadura barringtoniae TaxID=1427535 RepID=A0A939T3N2_9ACTN|nr:class I SAM-dependent methyltransferase [Actinomadura barringtoniae]MBO2446949.1 class I SAM-dependent methyltransferase [Actinomadura barringtoniae]
MQDGVASRLAPLLGKILLDDGDPADLPIQVRAWDGSSVGPAGAPAFVIRHRRALRRLLWKPGEMGLVRAYVAGELDIEGDVFAALGAVQRVMRSGDEPIRLSSDDKREIVRTAVTLGAVGPEPKPPPEEFPQGRRASGRGPLEESAAFFGHMLGETMAHGTGLWDEAVDLQEAQRSALEAVAQGLGLFPGARVLDLNPSWGAFASYASRRHGARVVALAHTTQQAEHIARLSGTPDDTGGAVDGTGGRVEARERDLAAAGDGPYDAILGLTGLEPLGRDMERLHELLAPGGRLLIQEPVRRPGPHQIRRTFTTSYMFPEDGELRPLGEIITDIEGAGLEVRGARALREHHARTLRAWAANLQRHWTECAELAGPGRARVWLLYLAASALACESGRIGVHEICAIRRDRDGRAGATLVEGRAVMSR